MSRISSRVTFKCSGAPDCTNIAIHECKKCKVNVHKYCNVCYKQKQYFCAITNNDSIHDDYPSIGADSEPPEWQMGSSKKKSASRGRQPSYLVTPQPRVTDRELEDQQNVDLQEHNPVNNVVSDGLDLPLCGEKRKLLSQATSKKATSTLDKSFRTLVATENSASIPSTSPNDAIQSMTASDIFRFFKDGKESFLDEVSLLSLKARYRNERDADDVLLLAKSIELFGW